MTIFSSIATPRKARKTKGSFCVILVSVANIIHTMAGVQLRLACHEIIQKQGHEEPTGRAKITPGFNLPAKYVLHTVGPIIDDEVTAEDEALLASCYRSCLALVAQKGLRSVAFCCISTGVFCFPPERAAEIAIRTGSGTSVSMGAPSSSTGSNCTRQ